MRRVVPIVGSVLFVFSFPDGSVPGFVMDGCGPFIWCGGAASLGAVFPLSFWLLCILLEVEKNDVRVEGR